MPVLDIQKLGVTLTSGEEPLSIVEDVSLSVMPGEILGLVGESGSGKTMIAMSAIRLLPKETIVTGEVRLEGTNVLAVPEGEMRRIRGGRIGMVFQEPMSALNPSFTIGAQIVSAIRAHLPLGATAARARALELLAMVSIPDCAARFDYYPHQLSGGMCQRAMIAMALAGGARLLIADEPTTSLDVTIQDQIIELVEKLVRETGIAVLFISHDLGLVAQICDKIAVAYAGQIVECGQASEILDSPRHPYTRALVRCVANLAEPGVMRGGIAGNPPLPSAWPTGCRFRARCSEAADGCERQQYLVDVASGHEVRCWRGVRSGS